MIDKRISYRGGGSYRGGSSGSSRSSSSGPGPGGQGARGQATQNPGGGGGGGPDPREQAAQRSREQAAKRATEEKKQREAALKAKKDIEAKQAAKDKAAKEKKQREEQEKRSKEKGKSLHGGPTVKEALKKAEIKKDIRDRQLEKMDVIPDDTTQLDLNKFGETIIPEALPKGHPDRIKEESEEAVKQLSTKAGTKEALKEFKALDTGRRYTPDFDLLEKLGVTRPEGILGSLVNTGEKYLDPKKMLKDAAIKFGMKKLGLGALNPILGLASLFGMNPIGWAKNRFAKKPKDMTAFNKLGLYDKRTPAATDTMDTLTAKARDAYNLPLEENVIAKNIARFTGKDPGGKSMMEDFYANQGSWSERVGDQLGTNLQEAGVSDKQKQVIGGQMFGLKEGMFTPQSVYDKAKQFDKTGFLGLGADPMTKPEFNEYIKSQGYTGQGLDLANGGVVGLFKYGGYLG